MKPRSNSFVPLIPVVFCAVFSSLQAADVNTTAITVTLNTDNPGNKYLGNGNLEIVGDVGGATPGVIELGNAFNTPITEFAMTGGTMTITTGTTLRNGGFSRGVWTNNASNLQLDGTLDMWDGNPSRFNSLNGSGSILTGFPFGGGSTRDVRIGVLGGGGTFSGSIADVNNGVSIRIIKDGAGTQIFDNLANQKPGQFVINAGAVELSSATAVTMPTQFFGAGNLIKSGAGALTVTGVMMGSGTTTVNGGALGFGSEISARLGLVAGTGTTLGLNFTGQATVKSISLGGSGPLAAGVYDSTHVTYGSYFTGSGQLNVLNGTIPTGSGTWSSTTGGYWNVSARWQSGAIANGSGNTATISAASAISVTLDSDETLGHLVFQGNNHTLNGAQTLTLAGTTPSVTVASGTSSRIETQIAGTSGLAKSGAGTLTLAGSNKTYTGGTAVNEGRLILPNIFTGSANYSVASGATLEFNTTGNTNYQLSAGTISGGGNLVKSGNGRLLLGASGNRQNISLSSGAMIDVQGGVLRGEFSNFSSGVNGWLNNKADLNVATGAFFDIWDSNGIVDAISGTGTVNKGWSANSSLTFGVDNGSGTFSGTISQGSQSYGGAVGGNFNLIKNGTGTQVFSGVVNPTGVGSTITVNAGTLQLAKTTALFNSTATSWTAAKINVKSAATLALNVDSAGTNGFTSTNLDTLLANISVANTAAEGLQSGAIVGIDTSTATGGTFTQGNAIADSTGANGGAIGLTKLGTGTLILDKTNTYTGATSVNGGKLLVTGNIASSAFTVSNAGTVLATDTAATIGNSLSVQSGAILAVGDAANATTATATVNGATTFNNSSIFSWDINSDGTSYDKLVTSSVAGEAAPGDAVFRIVVADTGFANGFWSTTQTWNDIFTTNGSAAITDWALVFGSSVSVVNSSFSTITPAAGSFSITGSTLTWTAVPEPTSALAGLLIGAGLLRRRRTA